LYVIHLGLLFVNCCLTFIILKQMIPYLGTQTNILIKVESYYCSRRAALQHTTMTIAVPLVSNPDLTFIPVLGPTSHWRAS